jgi:hypothetical protein
MLNFLIDCLMALVFLSVLATAAVLWTVFPKATAAGEWRIWGWSYDAWAMLHFVLLSTFAVIVLIHLVLHWTWVCGFISARLVKRFGVNMRIGESAKTLYGVATLIGAITLIGAVILAAQLAAEQSQIIP